ncbi:hypothetical protein LTR22_002915 [Elasticomyces elasticus]|nr:hypothetical protein LTR22_002915 [Elasticomyces elasticus]KAK4926848.1 hypothetical protein LTR49_006264 [Elasticomyces elasticus]KAK5763683.1 hypothetical protein LTS12_006240 [Elasticomyces elasticus]
MAIEKLGDGAIATLGAYQTLTDPAALVKELIDNALDANATSIAIEIHSNTLDSIQVRDNGHGIAPDDRPMVALPNCTSKLHDFDDLKAIGGSSLGFRGQALASAAEMSGSLTISTKVEGEQVATALKINQRGEVVGEERASLPVGTTVKVTDFIKSNPVRRQRAIKDAEKCLKHLKQTLQAYAFVRPHARVSLRVLKAKSDKFNYVYAPKPGGSIEDAALKIVGSACVSQCIWTVVEEHGFTLHAFVPRPDGDPAKVSNIGTFLCVDGRPVSAVRGTFKQMVKIFRDALKKSSPRFDGIKEPFIHLSVSCPSASYDPNIEPAKDDVLFEDTDVVIGLVRQLFAAVYPPVAAPTNLEPSQEKADTIAAPRPRRMIVDDDDFVTSLEPQHSPPRERQPRTPIDHDPADQLMPPPRSERAVIADDDEPPQRRAFRSNMYGCDEEDLDLLDARPPTGRTEADFEDMRVARKDVNVSNPWVMAKMNTSLRAPAAMVADEQEQEPVHEAGHDSSAMLPRSPARERRDAEHDVAAQGLPTPRPSSPSPPAHDFHPSEHVPDLRLARDGRVIGSQALPPPLAHTTRSPEANDTVTSWLEDQPAVRKAPAYDITLSGLAQEPPAGTPLGAIPDMTWRKPPRKQFGQTPVNRPFISPVIDGPPKEKVWFDHLDEEGSSRKKQKRQHQPRNDDGYLVRQGELGDLIDEPRPLIPPRRNRDIRDFADSVDLTGADSASSFIERRNYGQATRARSVGVPESVEDNENTSPPKALLGARGFIPASELAAMEARVGSLDKEVVLPPQRRKTSGRRALRELSNNASVIELHDQDDAEQVGPGSPPPTRSRPGSRRRRTTDNNTGKPQRTKSSRLPLERIPKGQGTHNIEAKLVVSTEEMARLAGGLDEEATLLGWNQPAVDAYNALASTPDATDMDMIAAKLHELLINRVSDHEMVQDLGELVRSAFNARNAQSAEMDGAVEG